MTPLRITASTCVLVSWSMPRASTSIGHDFLHVKPGDIVVVKEDNSHQVLEEVDWWLGYVIHVTGSARAPDLASIFQVADIDTGLVKTINADLVKAIFYANDH